ncbi:Transcription factor srm1 [Thalictrum thalictroides]|uniref:Transcription factor srm1 n=1 Tax=Thalictrum thalictroides TaxID=46969 RepID=A0A7J6V2A6_THATH|nr:Transcription factor srm1 [Thalictrum thalictroides]
MIQENSLWMIGGSSSSSSCWSRVQDKLFEQALVIFPEEISDRWQKIANEVPGKTAWEVKQHYEALVRDVLEIDNGRVSLPCYTDDSFDDMNWDSESKKSQISFGSTKLKHSESSERKKGSPWTPEEHKLFLIGLQKYGKGDWRSISRNAVVSRTPTQVASHAQKYYLRLSSGKKEKRRSSIHDITTVENDSVFEANNHFLDQQYHKPVWKTVQTVKPTISCSSQAGSSRYQQQNGF